MGDTAVVESLVVGPRRNAPHIVDVSVASPRRLLLEYETGERRLFDASPYMRGEFLGCLQDESYFGKVRVIDGGIAVGWPNGQDIGPEDLYDASEPAR